MGYGRISALVVARRMAVSIGVAVLVMATVVPMSTVAPVVKLAASTAPCTRTDVTCALILGGTTVPTPDDAYIDTVRDHFIGPTHPGQVTYIPVTAPMEFWPITGGRCDFIWLALGPPSVWGLDGPGWPERAAVEAVGPLRCHLRAVTPMVGWPALEDARAKNPSEPPGDLRLLTGRDHRGHGETEAGRAGCRTRRPPLTSTSC